VRLFGGPIHMMMRRYRFVEEDLVIGKSEDERVRKAAKKNEKLWNRLDDSGVQSRKREGQRRYEKILRKEDRLLFPGFVDILEESNRQDSAAGSPERAGSDEEDDTDPYAAQKFGGEQLTHREREKWRSYASRLNDRVKREFPEVNVTPKLPA
jgi:hypothetical protein